MFDQETTEMLHAGQCAGFRLQQVMERQPAIDVQALGVVPSDPMQVPPTPPALIVALSGAFRWSLACIMTQG